MHGESELNVPRRCRPVPVPVVDAAALEAGMPAPEDAPGCGCTRRDFVRAAAAASTALAAGLPLDAAAQNVVTEAARTQMKWSKAPCRFCGVGCGVNVAVRDGRVVATHGDPNAEVNRGINCVKGYFLSKIMYGEDRLTQPLLRMRNGRYDKDGEFQPVSWDVAFDTMAAQYKRVLKEKGPTAVGMFGSGQWTVCESPP